MLEFMAKRVNAQLDRMKTRNANAFMYVDEPGLQFLFSAMAGYGDLKGKQDLADFFHDRKAQGVHLCGNPDWDFLLGIDLDFLISRSLLSPATCCLVNPDGEKTVEEAFVLVNRVSQRLREAYRLI
jgi:hypothetical protein